MIRVRPPRTDDFDYAHAGDIYAANTGANPTLRTQEQKREEAQLETQTAGQEHESR